MAGTLGDFGILDGGDGTLGSFGADGDGTLGSFGIPVVVRTWRYADDGGAAIGGGDGAGAVTGVADAMTRLISSGEGVST